MFSHYPLGGMKKRIAASLLFSGALMFAQNSVDVQWNQVCQTAGGRPMRVKTTNGEIVDGYCMSVNVDEIAIRTEDHKVVKITRAALARMAVVPRDHQVRALGRGMRGGLRTGFHTLLTPNAPAALLLIPGTLAWGAVAAPFCVAGDLVARTQRETEIRTH
jgi:hypothetical protein